MSGATYEAIEENDWMKVVALVTFLVQDHQGSQEKNGNSGTCVTDGWPSA